MKRLLSMVALTAMIATLVPNAPAMAQGWRDGDGRRGERANRDGGGRGEYRPGSQRRPEGSAPMRSSRDRAERRDDGRRDEARRDDRGGGFDGRRDDRRDNSFADRGDRDRRGGNWDDQRRRSFNDNNRRDNGWVDRNDRGWANNSRSYDNRRSVNPWSDSRRYTSRDRHVDNWRRAPSRGYDVHSHGRHYRARPVWRHRGVPHIHRHRYRWGVGYRYPYDYRRYVIIDYYNYYLPPPPHHHVWVRHDDGAYLIALATGLIVGLALNDTNYYY